MEGKQIIHCGVVNEENINKICSYLTDYTLDYNGYFIEYLEEKNCLHIYSDGEIDEYVEIEESIDQTLKFILLKAQPSIKEDIIEDVEQDADDNDEEQEEIPQQYKGKHVVFKNIHETLTMIKNVLIFCMVVEIVFFIVCCTVIGLMLVGILLSILAVLQMIPIILAINYLLTIIKSLMQMDEDIEQLKIK